MMDLHRTSAKLFLGNVLGSIAVLLGITYFSRTLGPAPIGVFFLFEALLGMLSILADFGLRGAVEKRISEGEPPNEILASAVVLKLIPVTVIVVGILLLKPLVNQYVGASVANLLAFAVILQEAALLYVYSLKGELRVGEVAILRFARQVTWILVGMVLVSKGYGTIGIIYGLLTGIVVMLLWSWRKSTTSMGRPSYKQVTSLVNYGKFNAISSTGGFFYSWMDVIIIGIFLSQKYVGTYEVAWRVSTIVIFLSGAIAEVVFPHVSHWNASGDVERIESIIRDAITPTLFFVIPAFFGVLVFSEEILGLAFGSEFTTASLVLIILMAEKIFQSLHKIFGPALLGIDRPDLGALATAMSISTNLVLNLLLIPTFGIVGAAMATALAFTLHTVLTAKFFSSNVNISIPYFDIAWLVLSSVVMAGILFSVKSVVAIDTLPRLSIMIAGGIVTFGAFVVLHKGLRHELFDIYRKLTGSSRAL